ncbi:MAG: haloacid dehalogenase type II [Candidatus Bipolaricaulia bacterium]
MTRFPVLAFDAYGTLFDVEGSITRACEAAFPNHGEALSRTWRAQQLAYTWLRGLMDDYIDFWQVTADALAYAARTHEVTLGADRRERLINAYLRLDPFPDAGPALTELREAGAVRAILSNGTPSMLASLVEHAGWESLVTEIISVDAVGTFKPNPRVYDLALQRLGYGADEIGFVSANGWDVAGAKRFGFWTAWINRSGQPTEQLGYEPDMTVRDLGELVERL